MNVNRVRAIWLSAVIVVVPTIGWGVLEQRATTPRVQPVANIPTFEVDQAWPPKLPNDWVLGFVSSIAIDRGDHVWMLHRPKTVAADKRSHAAPPVLEFDGAGKFVRGWGGPGEGYEWPDDEHGIYVDDEDIVWIVGNAGPGAMPLTEPWRDDDMLLKFTGGGKFLRQFGHREQTRGNKDTNNLREPADLVLYRKTNELFIADGYGNRRVVVLDAGKLTFKRMWGAFGNEPRDVFPPAPVPPGTSAKPPTSNDSGGPPQFWIVHAIKVAQDGMVYVADRQNRRVQVFDIAGKYLNQIVLTPADSLAFAIGFSPDPQQQLLYIGDSRHERIVFVDRKTLAVAGEFRMKGLSTHELAVDSKGNVYTAQLNAGARRLIARGTVPAR